MFLIKQTFTKPSFKRLRIAHLFGLALILTTTASAQWSARQINSATFFSTLRPMSQGVYDHYSDKSFFCFMQENSNPYVVACDHSGGLHTWGIPQRVLVQAASSKYNYPTIDILPDRRLVMTFASPFDEALGFAISTNPADASSWTTTTVNVGRTHVEYPRIKVDRRGHIYLFYIHQDNNKAAHKRWYYFVKSENAGQTWTAPTLAIERELDDPYGMCELYVGYTAEEPYRLGEPERWWFAYTSSSGFQYTGTHNGGDNSANLIDTGEKWGTGDNFGYRWLYNITKGTNSGITNATSTTVVPSKTMDWDNGDAYGIAYHNIYHSHIFVTYFQPQDGHWYDAAHNDLGVIVSRNEMETATARAYTSPIPPASKDVGYVPVVTVNAQGLPTVEHDGVCYSRNGSKWNTEATKLPSGDLRQLWFTDGNYYLSMNGLQIYQSPSLASWTNIGSASLPNNHGYSNYSVFVNEGHAEAIINTHEYEDGAAGYAYGISAGEKQIPEAIVLRTPTAEFASNTTATVYAYVTDKVHGARSKVRNANNAVTLKVVSGNANIAQGTVNAVNGSAAFSLTAIGNSAQTIVVQATSEGLDSYYLNLYATATGTVSVAPIVSVRDGLCIFPNPVEDKATIEFSLSAQSNVSLTVYDTHGQKVSTLANRTYDAGIHTLTLDAATNGLNSGLYLVNLQTGNGITSTKLFKK